MPEKAFAIPERQSKAGVVLIFFTSLYKSLKGLWVLGVYVLLGKTEQYIVEYALLGLAVLGLILLVFSIFSYQNFQFHVDYQQNEFVLKEGVFSTEYTAIPFQKIQQVYFKRSLLQRAIGVYSVIVDTAGSSQQEIEIKALSETKADRLQCILMEVAEEEESIKQPDTTDIQSDEKSKTSWTYKLSLGTLLKLGLSSNYLRGVGLILFFVVSVQNELNQVDIETTYLEDVSTYVKETFVSPLQIGVIFFLGGIFLFLVGIFITCVEVFIKYFNLRLTQTKTSLELEMGLKTNTRISLKPTRVQLMRWRVNPVQRKFNLYEAQIYTAGSQDELQKTKLKIPGLKQKTLSNIQMFLYDTQFTKGICFFPHKLWFVRRMFFISVLLITMLCLAFVFNVSIEFSILVFAILFLLLGVFQWHYYKSVSLEVSDHFVVKRYGVWTKSTEIIQRFKLQSITLKQPIWYKKRGLYTITFHTAGGDVSFPLVNKAILQKINAMLYTVETSTKAWM